MTPTEKKQIVLIASAVGVSISSFVGLHIMNKRHEAKRRKAMAQWAKVHAQFAEDMNAYVDRLDQEIETAKFWLIVTQED